MRWDRRPPVLMDAHASRFLANWIIRNPSDKTLGKRLGDSHCGRAVAVPASSCYPTLLPGHFKKIQALWCGKIRHRDSGVPVISELEASCQATCLSVVGTLVAGPYRRKINFFERVGVADVTTRPNYITCSTQFRSNSVSKVLSLTCSTIRWIVNTCREMPDRQH